MQSLKKKLREDDDEQEEEKAPEEDDPVPWLDHSQGHILSYDEWVTKCTHKAKDGRKFMVCMALNCCPPKVLGQWAINGPSSKRESRLRRDGEVAQPRETPQSM